MNLYKDVIFEDLNNEQREIAELVGLEKYLEMVELLGGEMIYIPKPDCVLKAARNRKIKEDYRAGESYRAIARKYNLAKNTVINILSGGK